ncbi:MAG: TRAP transporter small permease subunit [Alphaproteobacteria bacterium]|nr:MAG: TRAP transporter small permease subunit [Alphaproteobacteria bacterium]
MLRGFALLVDALNEVTGRLVAWGVLAMVLMQLVVVAARYVFSTSDLFGIPSIWLQEGIVYLHGLTIMLGAAYALLYDQHVRVDIFRARTGRRAQDVVDLAGALLFILPLCALIAWSAWPNLRMSWMTLEGSIEPDGLPFRYLLKTSILVFAVLIGLQAVSIAIKAGLRLAGLSDTPPFRPAP